MKSLSIYCTLFASTLLAAENQLDEPPILEPTYLTQLPEPIDESSLEINAFNKGRKSAWLAGALSSVVPGWGHAYLGEYKTAACFFTPWGTSIGLLKSDQLQGEAVNYVSNVSANLALYNTYAAYRDARAYNGWTGYVYRMPEESLTDLLKAPFQWSIIKKPHVWGGLVVALGAGVGISHFMPSLDVHEPTQQHSYSPILAFPVGIGEEAYFRGFLLSALLEEFSPVTAIALSSIVFGAAHIPNSFVIESRKAQRYYLTTAIPFITAFGAYFGYLTYKNHSLKEAAALHSWYDFTLFLASYSVSKSMIYQAPTIGFSTQF